MTTAPSFPPRETQLQSGPKVSIDITKWVTRWCVPSMAYRLKFAPANL